MVEVSPFIHPIPEALLKDPEVRAYFEYLNRFLSQIRLQSGTSETNITLVEETTQVIQDQVENPEPVLTNRTLQLPATDGEPFPRQSRSQNAQEILETRQRRVDQQDREPSRDRRFTVKEKEVEAPRRERKAEKTEADTGIRREQARLSKEIRELRETLNLLQRRTNRIVERDLGESSLSHRVNSLTKDLQDLSDRVDVGV